MNANRLILMAILPVMVFGVQTYQAQNTSKNGRNWRLHDRIIQHQDQDTGIYINDERQIVYYNPSNGEKVDSVATFYWSSATQDWVQSFCSMYYYDVTGEFIDYVLGYITYSPYPNTKKFCSYDGQNRLTDIFYYDYNVGTGSYELTSREAFTYNGGNVSGHYYRFNLAGSVYHMRYTYQTDTEGRPSQYLMENSADSLSWVPTETGDIVYTAEDTSTGLDHVYYLSHDYVTDLIRMDGHFGKVSTIIYHTDWNGSTYDYTGRYLYQYNAASLLSNIFVQYYGADWTSVTNYAYTYDNSNHLSLVEYMNWDYGTGSWAAPLDKTLFSWELITSNEDETTSALSLAIAAYPNPFSQAVNLSLDSKSNASGNLAIYNVKGQLVKSFPNVKSAVWDGMDNSNQYVGNGIYLIQAEQSGKTAVRKIIRIR